MAQINENTLNILKDNEAIVFKIATAMGKKFRTVENWVRDNDARLALPAVRLIIGSELGVDADSLLEEKQLA